MLERRQYNAYHYIKKWRKNDCWQIKFFECMGGKSYVRCKCCMFPLIPTLSHSNKKEICNLTSLIIMDLKKKKKSTTVKALNLLSVSILIAMPRYASNVIIHSQQKM